MLLLFIYMRAIYHHLKDCLNWTDSTSVYKSTLPSIHLGRYITSYVPLLDCSCNRTLPLGIARNGIVLTTRGKKASKGPLWTRNVILTFFVTNGFQLPFSFLLIVTLQRLACRPQPNEHPSIRLWTTGAPSSLPSSKPKRLELQQAASILCSSRCKGIRLAEGGPQCTRFPHPSHACFTGEAVVRSSQRCRNSDPACTLHSLRCAAK